MKTPQAPIFFAKREELLLYKNWGLSASSSGPSVPPLHEIFRTPEQIRPASVLRANLKLTDFRTLSTGSTVAASELGLAQSILKDELDPEDRVFFADQARMLKKLWDLEATVSAWTGDVFSAEEAPFVTLRPYEKLGVS